MFLLIIYYKQFHNIFSLRNTICILCIQYSVRNKYCNMFSIGTDIMYFLFLAAYGLFFSSFFFCDHRSPKKNHKSYCSTAIFVPNGKNVMTEIIFHHITTIINWPVIKKQSSQKKFFHFQKGFFGVIFWYPEARSRLVTVQMQKCFGAHRILFESFLDTFNTIFYYKKCSLLYIMFLFFVLLF